MDRIAMSEPVNKEKKFSDVVIPRILNYLRVVQQLEKENPTLFCLHRLLQNLLNFPLALLSL